jgi:hypothetical protein
MTSSSTIGASGLGLPRPSPCRSLSIPDGGVVVAAAGFEDRTMALARTIRRTGVHSRAIVIRYDPGTKRNRQAQLVEALRTRGLIVHRGRDVLRLDRFVPNEFAESLWRRLKDLSPPSVLLDISSMSKIALLLCLDVCRDLNVDVRLFYAEARDYGPSKNDYETAKRNRQLHQPSIQVYSGVGEAVRAARLSSVGMQGEPVAAIMFMSFNESLTQALLNSVYPSRLFLINGRPPEHRWREQATAWIHERLRSEWPLEDNPVRETKIGDSMPLPIRATSTFRYTETVIVLLDLYWRLSTSYRIIAAPTGSKMQAVAMFFARALHPDIHIEYPTPKGYLKLYSTGIGKRWVVRLGPLGSLLETSRRSERAVRLGIMPQVKPHRFMRSSHTIYIPYDSEI